MEEKKEKNNTLVLGDLQMSSSERDVSELIALAKQTLKIKPIKNYLLERSTKQKRDQMSMVG